MKIRGLNSKYYICKNAAVILISLLIVGCFSFCENYSFGGGFVYGASTGTVDSDDGLNVRSGPGTSYEKIGGLSDGATVEIIDSESGWYKINYGDGIGYVSAEYVVVNSSGDSGSTSNSGSTGSGSSGNSNSGSNPNSGSTDNNSSGTSTDSTFESSIASFPESYKPFLRALHDKYPNWKFNAQATGLDWAEVIKREMNPISINLVPSNWDSSYKSNATEAYNAYGEHIVFDSGGYVAASEAAVKYYMDPRNFLNETSIFQFYTMKYDASTQTLAGINTIVAGSFMSKAFPESTFSSYAHLLMEAGKESDSNPLTLASIILQEQGYNGATALVSGEAPGYEGYYNFFNIGAYAAGGNSAVTNGLIYAKAQGWNSRTKSIIGGAQFFSKNFVHAGQSTLYLKKFNVMNGLSNVGQNQYMTAIYAANSEGIHLQTGYRNVMNYALTFDIPVYLNMPSSPSPVPTAAGSGSSSTGSSSTGSGSTDNSSGSGSTDNTGASDNNISGNGSGNDSGTSSGTTSAAITNVRMAGADRIKTSIEAANTLKVVLGVNRFQNIVLASGTSYADALSGTYLASVKNAPVILVTPPSVSEVANYVKSNLASGGTVYIVGGEAAVPKTVESALGSNLKTRRLAGANRYETNLLVMAECQVKKGDIIVCSGDNYPDALSASAIGKPILLVGKTLTGNQSVFLSSVQGSNFYMIGGVAAISDDLFTKIASYGTGTRIYGSDRYATSAAVARRFFSGTQKNLVLAYGGNYPDGISAGPLAEKLKAPIILVSSNNYTGAQTFIHSANVKNIYIMGGTGVISNTLVTTLSK